MNLNAVWRASLRADSPGGVVRVRLPSVGCRLAVIGAGTVGTDRPRGVGERMPGAATASTTAAAANVIASSHSRATP
jgi:hypothetical protein